MSPAVQEIIQEEIDKHSILSTSSAEYSISRNYIQQLLDMPWGKFTKDNFDLHFAEETLDKSHFGLTDVKKRILEFIAVQILTSKKANENQTEQLEDNKNKIEKNGKNDRQLENIHNSGKIICLIGPPGVGKTSIATSIADCLQRQYYRIALGGLQDVSEIKGHRRTYIGAYAGKIVQALKRADSMNPVIILDEIEKICNSAYGNPADTLLEVLDKQQNNEFLDNYLDIPIDLSKVLFVCTGNVKERISPALADRMEFIEIEGYSTNEKMNIAREYIIPRIGEETGISHDNIVLSDEILHDIIVKYSIEPGVRLLTQNIEALFRFHAVSMARGNHEKFNVTSESLKEVFKRNYFSGVEAFKNVSPGVIYSIYANENGNVAIYELIATSQDKKAHRSITITGGVDKVLDETARLALTYVKLLLAKIDPNNHFYESVFTYFLYFCFLQSF